jgi:acyl-CoA thioesterase-1
MKKLFLTLFILIIVASVGYFYVYLPFFAQTKGPGVFIPKKIVAYGDSLIQGVGATEGHDFISVLENRIGTHIINKGKSGDTTAAGLARIDDVLAEKPDMVIVLFGGNDALQKVPIEQTFNNLDTIINTLQTAHAQVVLLGIKGGLLGDPYESKFKALAKKYNVTYIPNILDGILGKQNLMFDTVHPNDSGYAKISDRVYATIKPLIGL